MVISNRHRADRAIKLTSVFPFFGTVATDMLRAVYTRVAVIKFLEKLKIMVLKMQKIKTLGGNW